MSLGQVSGQVSEQVSGWNKNILKKFYAAKNPGIMRQNGAFESLSEAVFD